MGGGVGGLVGGGEGRARMEADKADFVGMENMLSGH